MKKSHLFFMAVMAIHLCSCDNEVDLYPDDPPETLFVYGSFNGQNNLQQVRIRQSISREQDAYIGAKDSMLYLPHDSLEVYVERADGEVYPMVPVHLEKDPGIFGTDGNVIYQSVFTLLPRTSYTLYVKNHSSGELITARTSGLVEPRFIYPTNRATLYQKFQFTNPDFPFHIEFMGGSVHNWNIYVKYLDILQTGDTVYQKGLFSGGIHTASGGARYFPLDYLLQIISDIIPVDPMIDFRLFYRFDFDVWVGDGVLAEYLRYFERYQDNRRFVNNNIKNGLGLLYSCHYVKLSNVQPYESLLDSLRQAPLTKDLKFSRFLYTGVFREDLCVSPNPFDL